jgi:WD40 repeat protein
MLAAGGVTGWVDLWEVASGKFIGTLRSSGGSPDWRKEITSGREQSAIKCIDISPNCTLVAAGSLGGTITLWSVDSRKEAACMIYGREVEGLRFSHDGKMLVSWGGDLCLWDCQTGKRKWKFTAFGPAAFSHDDKTLAVAERDGSVKLLDVARGEQKANFLGHAGAVLAVDFCRDGGTLASSGRDNTIILWDLMTYEPKGRFEDFSGQLKFANDGSALVAFTEKGAVRYWCTADKEQANRAVSDADPVNPVNVREGKGGFPSPMLQMER